VLPPSVNENFGVVAQAPVKPHHAVTDLKPCIFDGACEPMKRASPTEREHVGARAKDAEDLFPEGNVISCFSSVPPMAHKAFAGYALGMNQKVKRECPVCSVVYDADSSRLKLGRQTSCSRTCSYKLRSALLQRREETKCGACGKSISVRPGKRKRARHGLNFCSKACAYTKRVRVVGVPYVRVAEVDRVAASKKAWETRRRNPKPYPESAREKARADAIERLHKGSRVSAFERKAAEVFRRLGFQVFTSTSVRNLGGKFAHVFDISIPARGIMVECHGTYWHGARWTWDEPNGTQAKNLAYEARKLAFAQSVGLDLRILWEHEFKRDQNGACLAVVL